ncbi:MAG TPA: RtcB family protein [Acidimicrobiales bacterium]|nr:RtcB family protein [Acidimicrobiales bacterium]
MKVIDGASLPIYSWASELEPGALAQAVNCANLPRTVHHLAVMADGHQGYGVPIGAVLALDGALSPYAVGNDIGCGMALVATSLSREDLSRPIATRSGQPGQTARDDIMGSVQRAIPAGPDSHGDRRQRRDADVDDLLDTAFDAMDEAAAASAIPLSTSQSTDTAQGKPLTRADFVSRGRAQVATLGSGNHFIELLAGPEGDVWVLVHSGSRGVGGLICANFHRLALAHCAAQGVALADPGLAWLPVASAGDRQPDRWHVAGRCYERAMGAALAYAELNRHRMLHTIAEAIERRHPGVMRWNETVNIHHNDAVCERHYDRWVWVHRKGAVKATAGTATITPGSMGTGSVLGRGLGNPTSFCSAAHGAGRALSRSRARRDLALDDELTAVRSSGGKVFAASTQAVLDEMPGAYKDLDEVMAQQNDLVEPVRRFTPLGTYKGVDRRPGGRSRRRLARER